MAFRCNLIAVTYALRRNIRVRVPKLEAALLSRRRAGEEVPGVLRAASDERRDQLHFPAPAGREYARKLDQGHTGRILVCAESAPADHAHFAPEGRRGVHRDFPALD